VSLGSRRHPPRRFHVGRDGFFHQHIDAGPRAAEWRRPHATWWERRPRRRLTLPTSLAEIREGLSLVKWADSAGAGRFGIHHGAKFGAGGLVDHTAVILPELSGPHYCQSMFRQTKTPNYGNIGLNWPCAASLHGRA